MREIKFRAWDGIKKRMVDISKEPSVESGLTYEGYFHLLRGAGFAFHVMQYTGLKDKNGVEIYEGDLIGNGESEENGTIYYCEKEAGFFINSNGFDFCLTEMDSSDSVIGNIHENPELLEQAA
jgi:uncharacterized phage protein (TIGR01671 family)